jgi:chromosome segregation ATPase
MEQLNKKPTLEESLALLLNQNERTIAMLDGIATKADENFIKIECRLNKIEDRLSKNEGRLSTIEDRLSKTEGRLSKIEDRLSKNEGRLNKIEGQLSKIEDRLSKNEARLHSLSAETSTNFTKVVEQLSGIKSEIVKIGAATRYEQFHEDQKKFE